MRPATSDLIRWTGLAAIVAGIIFAGIQPIHPPDELSSVSTSAWAIITILKFALCFLLLGGLVFGIATFRARSYRGGQPVCLVSSPC